MKQAFIASVAVATTVNASENVNTINVGPTRSNTKVSVTELSKLVNPFANLITKSEQQLRSFYANHVQKLNGGLDSEFSKLDDKACLKDLRERYDKFENKLKEQEAKHLEESEITDDFAGNIGARSGLIYNPHDHSTPDEEVEQGFYQNGFKVMDLVSRSELKMVTTNFHVNNGNVGNAGNDGTDPNDAWKSQNKFMDPQWIPEYLRKSAQEGVGMGEYFNKGSFAKDVDTLPSKLDWREHAVVSVVSRNQGACGSCGSQAMGEMLTSQVKMQLMNSNDFDFCPSGAEMKKHARENAENPETTGTESTELKCKSAEEMRTERAQFTSEPLTKRQIMTTVKKDVKENTFGMIPMLSPELDQWIAVEKKDLDNYIEIVKTWFSEKDSEDVNSEKKSKKFRKNSKKPMKNTPLAENPELLSKTLKNLENPEYKPASFHEWENCSEAMSFTMRMLRKKSDAEIKKSRQIAGEKLSTEEQKDLLGAQNYNKEIKESLLNSVLETRREVLTKARENDLSKDLYESGEVFVESVVKTEMGVFDKVTGQKLGVIPDKSGERRSLERLNPKNPPTLPRDLSDPEDEDFEDSDDDLLNGNDDNTDKKNDESDSDEPDSDEPAPKKTKSQRSRKSRHSVMSVGDGEDDDESAVPLMKGGMPYQIKWIDSEKSKPSKTNVTFQMDPNLSAVGAVDPSAQKSGFSKKQPAHPWSDFDIVKHAGSKNWKDRMDKEQITTADLPTMISSQMMMDCSPMNNGCEGSFPSFDFVAMDAEIDTANKLHFGNLKQEATGGLMGGTQMFWIEPYSQYQTVRKYGMYKEDHPVLMHNHYGFGYQERMGDVCGRAFNMLNEDYEGALPQDREMRMKAFKGSFKKDISYLTKIFSKSENQVVVMPDGSFKEIKGASALPDVCDDFYYHKPANAKKTAKKTNTRGGSHKSTPVEQRVIVPEAEQLKLRPEMKLFVHRYSLIGNLDEDALAKGLFAYGPLITLIYANPLKLYKSGIMTNQYLDPALADLGGQRLGVLHKGGMPWPNHAVTMVGFGEQELKDGRNKMTMRYFRIRNSWGREWGEDGYFRIKRKDKGAVMDENTLSVTTVGAYVATKISAASDFKLKRFVPNKITERVNELKKMEKERQERKEKHAKKQEKKKQEKKNAKKSKSSSKKSKKHNKFLNLEQSLTYLQTPNPTLFELANVNSLSNSRVNVFKSDADKERSVRKIYGREILSRAFKIEDPGSYDDKEEFASLHFNTELVKLGDKNLDNSKVVRSEEEISRGSDEETPDNEQEELDNTAADEIREEVGGKFYSDELLDFAFFQNALDFSAATHDDRILYDSRLNNHPYTPLPPPADFKDPQEQIYEKKRRGMYAQQNSKYNVMEGANTVTSATKQKTADEETGSDLMHEDRSSKPESCLGPGKDWLGCGLATIATAAICVVYNSGCYLWAKQAEVAEAETASE